MISKLKLQMSGNSLCGEEKIFCIGPTRTAKQVQKFFTCTKSPMNQHFMLFCNIV
jgi:hypothetical protein